MKEVIPNSHIRASCLSIASRYRAHLLRNLSFVFIKRYYLLR
jgi:hypothetical protein